MRGRAQAHAAEGTIGNAMAQAAQTDRLIDLGQAGGGRGCAKAAWMIWPGMTAATDLNSNDSSASADELEAKLRGCGLSEAPKGPQINSMSQDLHTRKPSSTDIGRAGPPEIALSEENREALRQAVLALEGPSYVARLSALAGRPIELLGQALPQAASDMISRGAQAALTRALRYALKTIPKEGRDPEIRAHKALAVLSGAMGGALGISAVLAELPISTAIMLRSIARIAQTEGEDLQDPETALACLQVFALGGRTGSDNLHETGYFAVRAAMAKSVTRALQQVAGRGVVDESTSAIVRLLAQIGSRFGLVVSQKVAAQAIPVLGAIGGAAVNAAFVDHFQTLARGHFIVRRLERTYGKGTVRRAYNQIRVSEGL